MSDNLLVENLRNKWQPVLEHADMPAIKDEYRKNITAIMLENQEKALKEETISGATSLATDASGGIARFDPVLISLVRRAMPNLIAYDICGVQPMSGPTGLIFAMRSKFGQSSSAEALFNEAPTLFSATAGNEGTGEGGFPLSGGTGDPLGNFSGAAGDERILGSDGPTAAAGFASQGATSSFFEDGTFSTFNEMAFSIDRTSVVARTRALKAEYTSELAQDLKAVHGLDAETELANILSAEILSEINREVIRTIYANAKLGAQQADLRFKSGSITGAFGHSTGTGTRGGIYDVDADSDGRWSAEKFRGLMFQIDREANVIAKETRRGKGNFIICTSDVASALSMSGFLNLTPTPSGMDYDADDTGNTFVGTLNGKLKVYIDPYSISGRDYVTVGYRGSSPYDAGMFYCPYVPLQMVRAVGENDFQPKIGFKTRYGLVNNPFVTTADPHASAAARDNQYYRIFRIINLHGSDVTAAS